METVPPERHIVERSEQEVQEVHRLRGQALHLFFNLMVCMAILAVCARAKAEESGKKEKPPLPTPIALGKHSSNQGNERLGQMIELTCTAIENSPLANIIPGPTEITDIIEVTRHCKVEALSDPAMLKGTSYATINIKFIQALQDPYARITPPQAGLQIIPEGLKTEIETAVMEGGGKKLLYLKVPDFLGQNLIADTKTFLAQHPDCTHLMLDFYDNPGGIWENGVNFLDLFFEKGTIELAGDESIELKDDETETFPPSGILILMNEKSGSVTELVIGGFTHLARHQVVTVGETTFGKYSQQLVLNRLPSGVQAKFTIAIWHPNCPGSGYGIAPDQTTEQLIEKFLEGTDPSLPENVRQSFMGRVCVGFLTGDIHPPKKQEDK